MKKIVKIISLILVIILVALGVVYANHIINKNYEEKKQEPLLDNIDIAEITNEDGLIFRIQRVDSNTDCNSVFLEVYEDGIYKLTNTQVIPEDGENILSMLVYKDPIEGTYEYDIKEIFLELKQVSEKEYVITTGSNETYFTDKENNQLIEFLKVIDVDLDVCMKTVNE